MDGELGAALERVLADPAQMEKLSQMAKELFGQAGETPGNAAGETPEEMTGNAAGEKAEQGGTPPAVDTRFLSALGKAFSGGREPSRSTALLMAMRPYMKPEKQAKLDRAMQIARMANIAGVVMNQYGGGGHGI